MMAGLVTESGDPNDSPHILLENVDESEIKVEGLKETEDSKNGEEDDDVMDPEEYKKML